MSPRDERHVLKRGTARALGHIRLGIVLLAALIPLLLLGWLATALVARGNEVVMAGVLGVSGVGCAIAGFGFLSAGAVRHWRLQRKLAALDAALLPAARIVHR